MRLAEKSAAIQMRIQMGRVATALKIQRDERRILKEHADAEQAAAALGVKFDQWRANEVQRIAEAGARNDKRRFDEEVAEAERSAKQQMDLQMRNVAMGVKLRKEEAAEKVRIAKQQAAEEAAASKQAHIDAGIRENMNMVDLNSGSLNLGGLGSLFGMAGGGGIGSMLMGVMGSVASGFVNAMKSAISFVAGIIQTTLGVLLRDLAIGFGNAMRDAWQTALSAAKDSETIITTLTTQGGMEEVQAGNAKTIAEGFEQARASAYNYYEVLRQINVFSPFEQEDIAQIYRTVAAFGIARDTSISVTKGIVDMGSAFSVSAANAERAGNALGKILAREQVTGREMLQLTRSGIPLFADLAQAIGVSANEFYDMAAAGQLNADVVLPALNKVFGEYNGMAEKVSTSTFTGSLAALADVGRYLLSDFFAPLNRETGKTEGLFGALIPVIQEVVSFFTRRDVVQAVQNWGRALGEAAQDAFDWARDAWNWGYNLMVQYGNGILSAAGEVLSALAEIGSAIASWLMPHSPPKILPNIDSWGKETMEVWLRGFTQADANKVFGTLSNELGGLMKSMFKAIGKDADKTVLPSMLMGLNESLGDLVIAYSGGGGLAEAQLRITSMFAGASGIVQDYVSALLRAQDAAEAVGAAERNLADVTKYYEDRLAAIDARIKALQNTQKDIGDQVEVRKLNLILNSAFVSEDRKALARARLEELALTKSKRGIEEERDAKISSAKAAVDAAKLEAEKRNEQLAAAKAMLDFYQQQNDLLNEQAEAIDKLAKAIEKLAKGAGGGGGGAGGGPGLDKSWRRLLPGKGDKPTADWDPFKPWRNKMEEFTEKWNKFTAGLKERWEGFVNTYSVKVFTGANPASESFATVMENSMARVKAAWETLPPSFRESIELGVVVGVKKAADDIGRTWNELLLATQLWKISMAVVFSTLTTLLLVGAQIFAAAMTGDWDGLWGPEGTLAKTARGWKTDMNTLWAGFIKETEEVFGPWYTTFETGWIGFWSNIANVVSEQMYKAVLGLTVQANSIIGQINKVIEAFNSIPTLADIGLLPTISLPNAPVLSKPGTDKSSSTTIINQSTSYNLGVSTNASSQSVQQNFQKMKLLAV